MASADGTGRRELSRLETPRPEGWVLLPPGDAALTRRVKATGAHWIVQERKVASENKQQIRLRWSLP